MRELTGGTGADVAFECVGVNAVLDTKLDAVRPGAVVVNVSIGGAPATIDVQKIVLKEIDLRGTIAYVRDHPAVIKMVQESKVDLEPFITGRIALEDLVEQGFDTLINHKDTAPSSFLFLRCRAPM
ncbi:Threonine dehydrogenase and related Zn-dependent dehydrogenases-like protein [Arthrobacter sp. FB24]|nr:Threonine dehydrogenase and related Zn-dependent dehydrogenases-like protein [Arthrobacter sp. FB24]